MIELVRHLERNRWRAKQTVPAIRHLTSEGPAPARRLQIELVEAGSYPAAGHVSKVDAVLSLASDERGKKGKAVKREMNRDLGVLCLPSRP
jgi:hypothetical protein